MQATCIQSECLKWHNLNSNESILQNLPTELLEEIFQHLGWEDVFVMRRTCKLFFDISTSRSLWICLFYRLSSEVQFPPILEGPISLYTAKELEYVVMHRISSEIRWATGAPPRVRSSILPRPKWDPELDDQFLLLHGGRWLLTCTGSGNKYWRVCTYDLETLSQEPRCIIDLDRAERGWHLSADMLDWNATSGLAFNLCLIPWCVRPFDSPSDSAPEQIHIYRLTVKGHGTEAILEARKLKSLHNEPPVITELVDFRGNFLVRSVYDPSSSFRHYEVCNWLLSDSTIQFKTYFHQNHDYVGDDAFLLPDGKVAVVSDSDISLYAWNLHSIYAGEAIEVRKVEPYWKLAVPMLSSQEVHFSPPYADLHATRMAITIDGSLYGLAVPHESGTTPSFQRISDADVSDMSRHCIRRNKICGIDANNGKIRIMNFLWPGDEDANRDVSLLPPAIAQASQHQLSLPYEWDEGSPLLDVYSNRVLSAMNGFWVVVDFAYK